MAPEGRRSGILTAGGVLAIISGALGVIGGLVLVILAAWGGVVVEVVQDGVVESWVLGAAFIAPGIVAIIIGGLAILGGRLALARRRFGWAITGGIASLFCTWVLGILALIFIAISKREFE